MRLSWAVDLAEESRQGPTFGGRLQITWLIGHVAVSKGVVEKTWVERKTQREDCVMEATFKKSRIIVAPTPWKPVKAEWNPLPITRPVLPSSLPNYAYIHSDIHRHTQTYNY